MHQSSDGTGMIIESVKMSFKKHSIDKLIILPNPKYKLIWTMPILSLEIVVVEFRLKIWLTGVG